MGGNCANQSNAGAHVAGGLMSSCCAFKYYSVLVIIIGMAQWYIVALKINGKVAVEQLV